MGLCLVKSSCAHSCVVLLTCRVSNHNPPSTAELVLPKSSEVPAENSSWYRVPQAKGALTIYSQ
jgi:hypothetical protein